MKNKEIFSMLKNADDSVIEQLTDMCEPLDKASDKRIFSRIQKKCGSSSECFETHNDYEVRGVDIYMRPKWIKPLRAAVIALALIGGIAGSMTLMKTMKKTSPDSKANGSVIRSGNADDIYVNAIDNYYPDGIITQSINGSPHMYVDLESMEKTVLCPRPNCKHNTSECIAKQVGQTPIIYNGYIYYFDSVAGVKEVPDGKKFYISSKFKRVSLSNSVTSIICEFTDCKPREYDGCVILDGKLYFCGDDMDPTQNEYGNITYSNVGGKHYFCSIDLKTGEYKNYGSIYDGDKQYESAHNTSTAQVKGFYDSKVYVEYSFSKNSIDIEELKTKDTRDIFTVINFEFDPESGAMSESELPHGSHICDDTYVYSNYPDNSSTVLYNGEKYIVDSVDTEIYGRVFNYKLFLVGKWYDIKNGTEHVWNEKYEQWQVVTMYKDDYIIADPQRINFEKLTEEELLALDNEDTDSNNKNKKVFVDLYSNTYDNGRIYSSDPARFIDYETMESTVLCSKPNCTHTNSECIGRIVGDCPLMTEDYIYYFTFVDGVKELKDGKREPYINSKLNRISLETSEKEEVVAFDGIAPAEFNGMVLSDNRLYFTCDDLNPTADDYGNYCFNNAGGTHYFCCVDLDTSEFINYGSIYDDDKQYPGSDNTSNGLILGYYDNNILVDYHFAKTLEPWDKYGFPEFTDIMFEFDIDTNSLKQTDMYPIRNIVYKNAYVYYDMEKGRTVIVDYGQVREFDIDIGHFVSYFNNKLFDYDNNKWYDLSDMSEHKWIWDQEGYEVIDYYKDSYIVILGNTTLKLSEDDLFALDLKEE